MSKGYGSVQRAILQAFKAEPDNAFLLSELCERVYAGFNRAEKKHRIAVTRAAKLLPSIAIMRSNTLGSELVFYDPLNLMSYAMARLKSDSLNHYRSNDNRWFDPDRLSKWYREARGYEKGYVYQHYRATEADLRAMLAAEGGREHNLIVSGGVWWREVEINKAKARGDQITADRLQAESDAELAKLMLDNAAFRVATRNDSA